jgi:Family of unknown function (DUF6600)/FecR protein
MVHAQKKTNLHFIALAMLLLLPGGQMFAQQDPPSRVARLNYVNGNVSMEPAGVDDWAPADVNRPFTIGDYLYADQNSQAELHLDVAAIRIGSQTSFGFLNLDDRTIQLKLTEGDMYIRVRNFGSDQTFEVDTPNAAITLLRDGVYRFRVDANGNMTFVVVRGGQAQITGGGQALTLNSDNSVTLTGTDQLSYDVELAPQPDQFDQWCQQRDAHESQLESSRYVSPGVIGYEDLDDNGTWQNSADGPVWYPRSVDPGWAPYHDGHWAWIDPWGWTWIDSMPWGFAPFHYGRWAYTGNRWGWYPGPLARGGPGIAVRPYYAPAMVAWFGGSNWGVGISVGGGPSLGWVPLGRGEVYTPAYHCSPRYFNDVNVYNTRIERTVNITNVYNTVYVNKTVYNQQFVNVRAPNAVMAMPQSAFASGRPVNQAARPVPQANLARVHTAAVVAPPVAPTRQSVLATAATRPAGRPAPQVVNRQVVAKSAPPPRPAPFDARQQYLQQHPGQPVNTQAIRAAVPAARPVAVNVRQAPAATPVVVRPGQTHGNAAAVSRNHPDQPAGQAGQPVAQPNRPAAQPNQPVAQQPNRPAAQPNQPAAQPNPARTPAPAAHGVPPNMRQNNTQPAANGRYTEPNRQPAPVTRAPQPQQTPERAQPAAERPASAARPYPQEQQRQPAAERPTTAPQQYPQEQQRPPAAGRGAPAPRPVPQEQQRQLPPERPSAAPRPAPQEEPRQPAAERPAASARPQPQTERQTQPAPAAREYPTRNSQPQERSQPQHQPPPKNDKNNSDNNDKKHR